MKPSWAGRSAARTPKPRTRGRRSSFTLIQRDGEARSQVVPDVKAKSLKGIIRRNVEGTAKIMMDEMASYVGLEKEFASHGSVLLRSPEARHYRHLPPRLREAHAAVPGGVRLPLEPEEDDGRGADALRHRRNRRSAAVLQSAEVAPNGVDVLVTHPEPEPTQPKEPEQFLTLLEEEEMPGKASDDITGAQEEAGKDGEKVRGTPVSLSPLTFEQAVSGLLRVKLSPEELRPKEGKERPPKGAKPR